MCKVMMFTNASKIKEQRKVISKIAEIITAYDNHGFGYAAVGSNGVFGERTTKPNKFTPAIHRPQTSNMLARIPFIEAQYNNFGKYSDKLTGPLMLHGRISTNHRTLVNTHPITKNQWHLIHNGVVSNLGPDYEMQTTNDTEHLVHYLSTQGIEAVEKNLSGYYAIGAIDPDNNLHIAKCKTADLVMSYISTIDSFVFATTDELIKKTCKAFKWSYEPIAKVKNDTYLIMQGNDILESRQINSIGMRSTYERDMIGVSLNNKTDIPKTSNVIDLSSKASSIDFTQDFGNSWSDIEIGNELAELAKECEIFDKYSESIDYDAFLKLSLDNKLKCSIIDPKTKEEFHLDEFFDTVGPVNYAGYSTNRY